MVRIHGGLDIPGWMMRQALGVRACFIAALGLMTFWLTAFVIWVTLPGFFWGESKNGKNVSSPTTNEQGVWLFESKGLGAMCPSVIDGKKRSSTQTGHLMRQGNHGRTATISVRFP